VLPAEKVTLPVGAAAPEAGLIEAVKTVVALCAIETGLAVSVAVVAASGGVRVITVEPDELVKLPIAV
jgi:hypothetical protein